jgi:O-antigen/teichoic acid export membrane protein
MTTSAASIPNASAAPSRGVVQRLRALSRSNAIWSLADQGVVSVGNFATTIFVVSGLPPRETGLYGILLDLTFFLNSIHAPLLTYPLSVKGAASDAGTTGRLTYASLSLTAVAGLCLLGAGVVAGVATGQVAPVIWAAIATAMWQLQEVTRRALMARLRVRAAVLGDGISYLGQALGVWMLLQTNSMTLERIMMVVAATSAMALLVQTIQVRVERVGLQQIKDYARQFWQMGSWLLAGNLTGIICIPAFAWVLVYFHGLEAGAVNLALLSLLKVSHPIMSAVSNLIIPSVASARGRGDREGMWRTFVKQAALGAVLLAPFFMVLAIVPELVLRLVYSGDHTHQYAAYAGTLRVIVLSYVLVYLANMTTAYLTAVEKGRDVFAGHIANTAGSIFIGLPMTAVWGVVGAGWGGGIAVGARLVANIVSIRRLR